MIFVFSLENEMSFQTVYSYFAKMAHYRNAAEIPLILVGTQGLLFKKEIPITVVPSSLIRQLFIQVKCGAMNVSTSWEDW